MYSGETQNYKLPQYEEQDMFDPVADWNPAFEKIDGELYKLNEAAQMFGESVEAAKGAAEKAEAAATKAETEALRAENIVSPAIAEFETIKEEFNQLKQKNTEYEAEIYSLTKRVEKLEKEVH